MEGEGGVVVGGDTPKPSPERRSARPRRPPRRLTGEDRGAGDSPGGGVASTRGTAAGSCSVLGVGCGSLPQLVVSSESGVETGPKRGGGRRVRGTNKNELQEVSSNDGHTCKPQGGIHSSEEKLSNEENMLGVMQKEVIGDYYTSEATHPCARQAMDLPHSVVCSGDTPKSSEVCSGNTPKSSEVCSGNTPKSSEVCSGGTPKSSEVCSGDTPKSSEVCSGDTPKSSEVCSGDTPKSSEVCSGNTPKSSEVCSGNTPKSSEVCSGGTPKSSEVCSGDTPKSSEVCSGDTPKSSEVCSGDTPKSSEVCSGDTPKSSEVCLGDTPKSSEVCSGDTPKLSEVCSGDTHKLSEVCSGNTHKLSEVCSGDTHKLSEVCSGDTPKSSEVCSGDTHKASEVCSGDTPKSSEVCSGNTHKASEVCSGDIPKSSEVCSGDTPKALEVCPGDLLPAATTCGDTLESNQVLHQHQAEPSGCLPGVLNVVSSHTPTSPEASQPDKNYLTAQHPTGPPCGGGHTAQHPTGPPCGGEHTAQQSVESQSSVQHAPETLPSTSQTLDEPSAEGPIGSASQPVGGQVGGKHLVKQPTSDRVLEEPLTKQATHQEVNEPGPQTIGASSLRHSLENGPWLQVQPLSTEQQSPPVGHCAVVVVAKGPSSPRRQSHKHHSAKRSLENSAKKGEEPAPVESLSESQATETSIVKGKSHEKPSRKRSEKELSKKLSSQHRKRLSKGQSQEEGPSKQLCGSEPDPRGVVGMDLTPVQVGRCQYQIGITPPAYTVEQIESGCVLKVDNHLLSGKDLPVASAVDTPDKGTATPLAVEGPLVRDGCDQPPRPDPVAGEEGSAAAGGVPHQGSGLTLAEPPSVETVGQAPGVDLGAAVEGTGKRKKKHKKTGSVAVCEPASSPISQIALQSCTHPSSSPTFSCLTLLFPLQGGRQSRLFKCSTTTSKLLSLLAHL